MTKYYWSAYAVKEGDTWVFPRQAPNLNQLCTSMNAARDRRNRFPQEDGPYGNSITNEYRIESDLVTIKRRMGNIIIMPIWTLSRVFLAKRGEGGATIGIVAEFVQETNL